MKTSQSKLFLLISGFCLALLLPLVCFASAAPPRQIAVLLPLHGANAEAGEAIRDGMIAAYYQSLGQDLHPPVLRLIDTSDGDVVTLYRRTVEQGADIIVGPLNKNEGAQLAETGALPVPTLLLNTIPLTQIVPNLYQFSLSPEDEAWQVAAKAQQDHRQSALLIVPASRWGQRVTQSFLTAWLAADKKVVGEMYYDDPADLSAEVAQLLHLDQSEKRFKALQHLLHEPKMRLIAYRRQDADMIFLVAKPELAREVRPLLKFYYAAKIPVYATSHIYSGTPDPKYDQDLDGVIFCAMPWEIAPEALSPDLQAIRRDIEKAWPRASRQAPQLFAFGVDSYRLARKLNGNLPTTSQGATGTLILQSNKVWARELLWAQMVNGEPKLLSQ